MRITTAPAINGAFTRCMISRMGSRMLLRRSPIRFVRWSLFRTVHLYDWFIEKLDIFPSKQYEFARLNMNYTVMSKRKLLQLVEEGYVEDWDDPRMPTISGLRRRGYTPASIREFCERIGVAKRENMIDVSLLEFCIREDLNKTAWRRMAVLDPIKLVITNYPEGQTEDMYSENNPEAEGGDGGRDMPFSRELVDRARRLYGRAAKEIFPPGRGPDGASKKRLHCKMRGF